MIPQLKNCKIVEIEEVHNNLVLRLDSGDSLIIKECEGFGPNIDFAWHHGVFVEEEVGDRNND